MDGMILVTRLTPSSRRLVIASITLTATLAASAWAAPPPPPEVTNILPSFGTILGGTHVTFTGLNFEPPMAVQFGGSSATDCTTPVSGAFTCTAPPAATEGPVTVTVKNQNGNNAIEIPNGYLYVCASCTVSPIAMRLEGADPGGTTEPNGILEPGETNVSFAPSWFNTSDGGFAAGALTGALSNLSTDSSYVFTAPTAAATYGAVPSGDVVFCTSCYSLSFSFTAPRPSTHVDVTVVETPSIAGVAAPDDKDARTWTIHVGGSFTDVLFSNPFYPYIEHLLHNRITFGTGGSTFSPNLEIPRDQMAAFIARALAGGDDNVPDSGTVNGAAFDCTNGPSLFGDVPVGSVFCRHIHFIANQNVTQGCGGGNFCPGQATSRQEMAAFVARALLAPGGEPAVPISYGPDRSTGRSYDCTVGTGTPPGPNGGFPDVALGGPFCKDIGYIWAHGVVDGFPDGTYGPDLPTTRGQMAKFLVNAFQLAIQKAGLSKDDARLSGNSIAVRPGSFTASATGVFLLPSGKDAPTLGGATLRVFDTGSGSGAANFPGTGGAQVIPLPAGQWSLQNTASGPTFAYTGVASVDPCTSVTISSAGQVKASCSAGITLQTPFSGDAALILDAGASRFCATWQGTTKKNDGTGLTRTDSPAPERCPAVEARAQALQFTAPVFSNGLTVYQFFPINGAQAPNIDALKITKVTQPLLKLFHNDGGGTSESGGCQATEPIPCTRQIGAVSIAPDGKSLVYDLNPGQAPQPIPTFPELAREPLGAACNMGTVDPNNLATTGTEANPSLYCIRGDEFQLLGQDVGPGPDLCNDVIDYWPFPFQFTVSDGVTESTQTMILTMFDHTCVPVSIYPTITTIPPVNSFDPPQLLAGPTTAYPTLSLNQNLPAISLGNVTTGITGGGATFTVPANCPTFPASFNVTNTFCTATGSLSMDSGATLLQAGNGATIQLNQPLTVLDATALDRMRFNSVTITPQPTACPLRTCYLQNYVAVIYDVGGQCWGTTYGGLATTFNCETGSTDPGR